ncbi:hypothetical protein D104_13195 [Marinomonas profundimaris]|uniref:Uncharacterized protein n=1 Tax=Marinomonas profundimaris TaxID=1208321 RepID=W1RRL4_9GAMM|nr:hypothetical protein D104_13195 [Marinomonas profundimaris]
MVVSPNMMKLMDSVIRIILTLAFFYLFKDILNVQNDLLLAFISVLFAFIVFRSGVFIVNKWKAKKTHSE